MILPGILRQFNILDDKELQILRDLFPVPAARRASVRPEDVLVASYPRSGNTWVRWLLTVYFMKLGQFEFPYDFSPGKLIPDIHMSPAVSPYEAITNLGYRLIKSHQIAQFRDNRMIYVVRKPADCLVSFHRYIRDLELARLLDRDVFADDRPSRLQVLRTLIRHWRNGPDTFALYHLESWMLQQRYILEVQAARPGHICLLTYEQLHRQGPEAVTAMLKFLEVPVREDLIRDSLQYSTVPNLQLVDRFHGVIKAKAFYRKGKVGDSRSVLRPETLARIESVAGELYNRAVRAL